VVGNQTALLQQKDSAHHSGKPNLKPPPRQRDLCLSAVIAAAPLFSSLEDWTIYTPKAGVTLGDL